MEKNIKKLTYNTYIISRYTHSFYTRELRKLGISMGQFPFIMHIAEHPACSQEDIVSGMLIGKSTTAAIIRQLMENGIATRTTDAKDRRLTHLRLTAKGEALVPEIEKVIERCQELITANMSDDEKNALGTLLEKLKKQTVEELKN
ncbi:MAG: MarR family transcriptional regulator [Lentisphaeria bacterium]|nr:MarR family transcriptional regulator [Lentisphaeria bacterium]